MKSFKQVPGPPKVLLALFSRFGDKTKVVQNFRNLRSRFGDIVKLEIHPPEQVWIWTQKFYTPKNRDFRINLSRSQCISFFT